MCFTVFGQRTSKPIDWQASLRVGRVVGAEIGECARNAARAFLRPRTLPIGAEYVEGAWMVTEGNPDAHVWIETRTYIIDPTLAAGISPGVRIPIASFTHNEVAAHVATHRNQKTPWNGKLVPILETRGDLRMDHAMHILEGWDGCCSCSAEVRYFFAPQSNY